MKITYRELLIQVSGEYLIEELPDNWTTMDDLELDEFIDEHTWEPFENYTPSQVWEFIDQAASGVARFLKRKGIEIEE